MIYQEMLDTDLALTNRYIRRIDGQSVSLIMRGLLFNVTSVCNLAGPFSLSSSDKKGRGGDVGLK